MMTNETTYPARASWLTIVGAVLAAATLLWPEGASAQEASRVAEGGRLYGQTCGRCHNPRPSTERTDREWRTVMGHMRARANLSRSDARAILAFLRATNGISGEASEGEGSKQGELAASAPRQFRSLLFALDRREGAFPFLRSMMPAIWWTGDASAPAPSPPPGDRPGGK